MYWPKSLLPDKIPTARILSYGYNSKFLTFFPAQGPVNQSSLNGHASNFLSELSNLRSGTDSVSMDRYIFTVPWKNDVIDNTIGESSTVLRCS